MQTVQTLRKDNFQCLEARMIKILVFRNRKNEQITCMQDCPNYDDLDNIVKEFNASDNECTVSVEKIKYGSLTEFLLNNYKTHRTSKTEIDECLRALDFGVKRLTIQLELTKQELQAINAQKYTQI